MKIPPCVWFVNSIYGRGGAGEGARGGKAQRPVGLGQGSHGMASDLCPNTFFIPVLVPLLEPSPRKNLLPSAILYDQLKTHHSFPGVHPAIPVPSLPALGRHEAGFPGTCEGKTVFLSWRGFCRYDDQVEVRGDAEPVCVDEKMQGGKGIPELIQNSGQEMLKATISKLGTIFLI